MFYAYYNVSFILVVEINDLVNDVLCQVIDIFRRVMEYIITKTCLYNFDPLKPHFYKVKLGFTGVYIIFLISAKT